jgi:hypothetical protein
LSSHARPDPLGALGSRLNIDSLPGLLGDMSVRGWGRRHRCNKRPFRFFRGTFPPYFLDMFTIEHNFDATVITLVDDVACCREEDVRVALYEDKTVVEQVDEKTGEVKRITLSVAQLNDLLASVHLPEGAYSKRP